MYKNITALFLLLTVISGCITIEPTPNQDQQKSIAQTVFGTNNYVKLYEIPYSGPASDSILAHSNAQALEIADIMSQSEITRIDLIITCGNSETAAREIKKALRYKLNKDWSKLNLLFIGSPEVAKQLKPIVQKNGIFFNHYANN